MSAIAAAIATAAVVGGVASYQGAKKQRQAIGKAARGQEAFQQNLLDFQREVFEGGQPFRDISLEFARTGAETLPQLQENVMNPTLSAGFGLAAQEGLQLLSQNAAVTGSPTSGPAQIAKGRFMAGLSSAETDRMMNNMFRLAGFGTGAGGQATAATGQAGQALGAAGGVAGNLANLQVAQGAVQGGLYGSIGQTIAQLPMAYQLSQFMNQPGQTQQPLTPYNPRDYTGVTGTGSGFINLPQLPR